MAGLAGGVSAQLRSIALVHYTAPPVVGGVEHVLDAHARLLADAGHRVRIVAGRGASGDPRVAFVGVPLADTQHPAVIALQVGLDAGRIPAAFDATVATLAGALGAALGDADVVIAHNVASLNRNLALTAALHGLATRAGAPRLILWHHDLAWTLPAYRPTLHEGHPWDLLRNRWPGATQVTISAARRADLAALQGLPVSAVRVVPNGVDITALLGLAGATVSLIRAADLLAFDPLILLPVRITPRKNIELALRVVAALRAAGRPHAGLVVTGPVDPHLGAADAYLAALVGLRQELGLDGAAVFLAEMLDDPADRALVLGLYRLADLLLLPSFDEGFGIPILEAAAHRLPIVCSNLPSLREMAGEAATYFEVDADPGLIAAMTIARLDGDALVSFARRVRTEYAWEAVYRREIAPLLEG
ncbi:MAG: glycosyltransferase [Chloroflexota bacterium]